MTCEYCDESFSSEKARIEHILNEHDDELSSHDRDELKDQLKELEDKQGGSFSMDSIPLKPIAAVLLLGAVMYGVVASGVINFDNSSTNPADGNTTVGALGSTHEHAEFAVYLDGEQYDFTQQHFHEITPEAHIHVDGNANTLHKEATGVTYGYFFDTFGWEINETCITTHEDETYCEDDQHSLEYTIDGEQVDNLHNHILEDGERLEVRHE